MKKWLSRIGRFLQQLSVFDWLIIFALAAGLIFSVLFFLKQEKWVRVEVKVGSDQWWWDNKNPPTWLADSLHKGDLQYDNLGRKVAEVLDVKSYEWFTIADVSQGQPPDRKIAYVTLNLRAEVDKARKKLKFNHKPLEVGQPIDLNFGNIGTQGLVTFIEGMPENRNFEDKTVEARLAMWSNVFPETLGVQPWLADAITVGDKMKDTQGRVVAEVLSKNVSPAEKIVTTGDGRVFVAPDPLKKDVILTLKLKTFKENGINYFLDDFKVKVDSDIFLALPQIDVFPKITRILE